MGGLSNSPQKLDLPVPVSVVRNECSILVSDCAVLIEHKVKLLLLYFSIS